LNAPFDRLVLEFREHRGHPVDPDGDAILYDSASAETAFREGTTGTHASGKRLACIILETVFEGDWEKHRYEEG
jgi:hypothetical protein